MTTMPERLVMTANTRSRSERWLVAMDIAKRYHDVLIRIRTDVANQLI